MSIRDRHLPLDFISCVQTWMSSWISSGATSLRVHDSSQRGFGGAAGSGAVFAPFCLSLEAKTFLKNGMARCGAVRGRDRGGGVGCIYFLPLPADGVTVTQVRLGRARDAAVVARCRQTQGPEATYSMAA